VDHELELRYDAYQDQFAHQDMRQRVSARLVAASSMLELTGLALHETIIRELEENPALEAEEVATCDVCGAPLHGSICAACLRLQKIDLAAEDDWSERTIEDRALGRGNEDGDEFDAVGAAADRLTLGERLLNDLCAAVPGEDRPIAEQLVGNLDERGYLDVSVEEVADNCGVSIERVEAVLAALQSLEPVGVGARDLRECLLIQIDHLALQGFVNPLARLLVDQYMSELPGRRVERLARLVRVPAVEIDAALVFIRERLNPFPAQGHAGSEAIAEARATYTHPDVVIGRVGDDFVVEVVEGRRYDLRLAQAYQHLAARGAALSTDEQAHVRQYLTRARFFVQNVNQRRQTIKKITEAIVKAQSEFLKNGVRHLIALTRSQIADQTGVDESTVSRATNGKHAMLPNGQVVSFDVFFTPALVVHDVIKEILAAEGRPMTDADIARALDARGIHIARRTVAKYRAQIGVLPSMMRPDRAVGARAA
jgi:RNA polymerase sigma-54 factor